MISRKSRRLSWYLLVCYILVVGRGEGVGAEFELISPRTELDEEVRSLNYSPEQIELLKEVIDAGVLLEKKDIKNFFDKNFSIDGGYGELKNGIKIEKWEELGMRIGLTRAEAEEVYKEWWERKEKEVARLREGGEGEIEKLIESEFREGGGNGELKTGKEIKTRIDWENFAREKGLAGGGLILMGMYGINRKSRKKNKER